jgi:hypothetical protein
MNILKKLPLVAAILGATIAPVSAVTYTEAFEGTFPAWESDWLGTNSNLQNYYGVGQDRGNNPDGLWIQDGLNLADSTVITFGTAFGQSLTSLSFDVATWSNLTIEIFDSAGVSLGNWNMQPNYGAYTDSGTYQNFSATSTTGIGGFRFYNSNEIEGYTSIDNVIANTGGQAVPDSASTSLLVVFGVIGIASFRRRFSA